MIKVDVDVTVYDSAKGTRHIALDSDLNGEVTLAEFLQFTKASLILIADAALTEEQALGFDKTPVVAVDGRVGKAVIDVNPLGSIEFTARADMNAILLETYIGILGRSPVLSGDYKAHNFVFWKGAQVAKDLPGLQAWLGTNPDFGDKDLIRFINIQPYARKLERLGVTVDRQKSRTVTSKSKKGVVRSRVNQPNGTYFLTARAIRSKYKRNSIIRFEFVTGTMLGIVNTGYDKVNRQFKTGKPRQIGRAYLYPCITISVSESGIL